MGTPLPPIDRDQVAEFWRRCVANGIVHRATPVPPTPEPLGDSIKLADELIALVISGPKRATAGALVEYELEAVPVPTVGTIIDASASVELVADTVWGDSRRRGRLGLSAR
jgi:hypothetical protein